MRRSSRRRSNVGFTPEAIQYEPTGGVPAGNYFAEVCVFGTPLEPRTYTGTFTIDDTPAPHPYLARWQVFPANPPLARSSGDPWGNPSTDTRDLWCWDAGEAADCDKVVGNLASRAPWDHNARTNTPTLTTIGNNAVTATSWANPLCRARPGTGRRARAATTCTRGRTTGSSVIASRTPAGSPGRHLGRLGGGDEPVRRAQPHARLVVLPRLQRAQLERPGRQLRPHRDLA